MAKFCSKCGRTLPDGVEICPDCHAQGGAGEEAAPFTRISMETEVWKDPADEKKRRRPKPGRRARMLLYALALALVIGTVSVLYFSRPLVQVQMALRSGAYEKAYAVYTRDLTEDEAAGETIGALLRDRATAIVDAFDTGEMDEVDVDTEFHRLYAFGLVTEDIDTQYGRFNSLRGVRTRMSDAEILIAAGAYLDACNILRAIPEDDTEYEQAQQRAAECLELYAQSMLSEAQEKAAQDDYVGAISQLRLANVQMQAFGSFSNDVDEALTTVCSDYERYVLAEAETLAGLGEYTSAGRLVQSCIDTISTVATPSDALTEQLQRYTSLSESQTTDDAINRAQDFYAAGNYADAFRELDKALERLDDPSAVERELANLEARYVSDVRAKVRETMDGDRSKIADGVAVIEEAMAIRDLEGLYALRNQVEEMEPLDLITCAFIAKEGDVFRDEGTFKGDLSGWMWGGNGASLDFALDERYDVFEGTLAVRGDKSDAVGSFEIYCDGELVYQSGQMGGDAEDLAVHCDVTGCRTLTILFGCSYDVSTRDDGYCYHGLCQPTVMSNLL